MFEELKLLVLLLWRRVVNTLLFDLAVLASVLDCCCIEACPGIIPAFVPANSTATNNPARIGDASWFICSQLSHTIVKILYRGQSSECICDDPLAVICLQLLRHHQNQIFPSESPRLVYGL